MSRIATIFLATLLLMAWAAPGLAEITGKRTFGSVILQWTVTKAELDDEFTLQQVIKVRMLCGEHLMSQVYLVEQTEFVSINIEKHGCSVHGEMGTVYPSQYQTLLAADLFLYPGGGGAEEHFEGVLAVWKQTPPPTPPKE